MSYPILTAEGFKELVHRAGKVVMCSWALGWVHFKSDDRWTPIIVFHDSDKIDRKGFSYCFGMESLEELRALARTIDNLIKNFECNLKGNKQAEAKDVN